MQGWATMSHWKYFRGTYKTILDHFTVSLLEKRWQTVLSSSIFGGTQTVTGFPWLKLEGNSRHGKQRLWSYDRMALYKYAYYYYYYYETHGHRYPRYWAKPTFLCFTAEQNGREWVWLTWPPHIHTRKASSMFSAPQIAMSSSKPPIDRK